MNYDISLSGFGSFVQSIARSIFCIISPDQALPMRVANELTEEMHHALGVGGVEGGAGGGSAPPTVPLTAPLSAQNDETLFAQQTRREEPIPRAEARESPLFSHMSHPVSPICQK